MLPRLWQDKGFTTATGFVSFKPRAERALRDVHKAFGEIRNLLVVRLDAIGDNFLFFDNYRKLRKLAPKANIVVFTYSENRPIYDRCKFVNRVHYVDRDALASNKGYREETLKNLRETAHPWDLVLNPLYSREYLAEEIVAAAPALMKIGLAGDTSNISPELMKLTDPGYSLLLPVDNSVTRHELHRNNEVLSLLGSQDDSIIFEAPLTAEDRAFAARLIGQFNLGEYGVIFPGTKGGTRSIKYWGSENYASLMDELRQNRGWELMMMLGGAGEEQIACEIAATTHSRPMVFQGDFSLWQAAAVLEKASFYVGSDTSIAHIATALRVPTFVLLGGGHYGRFFPFPDGFSATSITRKLDCYHCNWKCKLSYNKCIADIEVSQVLAAMKEKGIIKRRENQPPAKAPHFQIAARRSPLPRVDLILPPGMQTWHLRESWAVILEKAGCLNRVFRPTPETTEPVLSYLRSGGNADFLLALGGDHHLGFLHDTEEKQAAWQRYRGHRVCNSFESTRDSLYKRYVSCVKSALKVFTHFAHTDEVDAKIFETANVPGLWWPQAADRRLFANYKDLPARKPSVFFCGKVWNEYPLRKALLQNLQAAGLCNVIERASAGEMVEHYNQHLFAINLPGVLGGFNVRTYEAMSCGCALLQFQPALRPANNALFEDGVHLAYYDYTDVERLKGVVQRAIGDPTAFMAMAQRGYEELTAHHTIEKRFAQLVDWVFDGRLPSYPQYGAIKPDELRRVREHRYVNDRYLFEGRPMWNQALNEFADLQFVNYHAMLPRLCAQGETLAQRQQEVEAMRVFRRAVELDSDIESARNNLGVLCWQRGERMKAFEYFEAALAENPNYRPAVINYGEALALSGRSAEAQKLYADYTARHDDVGIRALIESNN